MNQEIDVMADVAPEYNPMLALDTSQSVNRYEKDSKLLVQFHTKAVLNPVKSTEAGRPIYDGKDYIKIYTPGSQLSVIDAPVTDGNYLQRFGKRYEEWKQSRQNIQSGTPLEMWPQMLSNVTLIAELKASHVHTVEQLADLPDSAVQKLMGGIELRRRAGEYLATAKAGAADAEKEQMKAELEALKAQMAELMKPSPAPAAKEK